MGHKVINFGTANIDEIMQVPAFPLVGETKFTQKFSLHLGGKGANQASAVSKAGAKVNFLGSIGKDRYGEMVLESLIRNGVDVSEMQVDEKIATGVAHVWADDAQMNSIICYLGANMGNEKRQIERLERLAAAGDIILTTLEYSEAFIMEAVRIAQEKQCIFMVDPSGNIELAREKYIAEHTFLIKPNEVETEQITGIQVNSAEDARQAAESLKKLGYSYPIVSLGAEGAVGYAGAEPTYFPPCRVKSVDSTGAGDAFIGYIAAGIANGWELGKAIRTASRAAAWTTTKTGAAEAVPTIEEVLCEERQKTEGEEQK